MDDLVRGVIPEGYQIELFEGTVIMTPQGPEQSRTVFRLSSAAEAAELPAERVLSDVLIKFPGENDAAPDLTILAEGATRAGNSYFSHDVLAVVEVPSEPDDDKDYVRNVRKYGRYGIRTYLVADPFKGVCTLMTEPYATGYGKVQEVPYGETVTLYLDSGEVVPIDTSTFPVHQG
ncbi:Uma2 family endonuclease [Streptomyces sp. SB3404]|uniref:Uma2 family endonuclease n=2 Tax=Streptomyces boncukensis TaxID=2711219 RepID=A0A6G4X093_9ACTN|nr:Uma2 family endonuclease [Streptomyces boncukensis]